MGGTYTLLPSTVFWNMIQEFLFQTLQKGKLWEEFVNFGLWWKVRRRFYWMNMSSVEFWKEYVFSIFLNCGLQERVHLNFLAPHPSVERLWSFWLDEEIWLELESFDVISVMTSPVFSSGIVPSLIGQLFKSNQFYSNWMYQRCKNRNMLQPENRVK